LICTDVKNSEIRQGKATYQSFRPAEPHIPSTKLRQQFQLIKMSLPPKPETGVIHSNMVKIKD